MLRNRPGPSRAAPSTTCQKCLRKGHYSYECTSSVQERPYASRASRTQQLANPKLKPKLTETVPEEFVTKKEHQQSIQTRRPEPREPYIELPTKRARSASYSSVSTISTRHGHSRSPSRSPVHGSRKMQTTRENTMDGIQTSFAARAGTKRGRSFSVSPSLSDHSHSQSPSRHANKISRDDRNTRRRHSSISPAPRGRALYGERGRRRVSDYDSYDSRSSSSGIQETQRRRDSLDRSRVAKERASYASEHAQRQPTLHDFDRDGRVHSTRHGQERSSAGRDQVSQRERSLSPYTKRLRLTQAMTTDTRR